MTATNQTSDPAPGERVLDWLVTAEARTFAARWAARRGLPADDGTVDDLVADAQVAILGRMGSGRFEVDNPAAYGTQVMKSIIRQTLQGRDRDRAVREATAGSRFEPRPGVRRRPAQAGDPVIDDLPDDVDSFVDDLRIVIEVMQEPTRPWLTGAALAYLALAVGDVGPPDWVPQPKAGATSTQARGWAALWFAGERDLFPGPGGDPSARRRRRGRCVEKVLEHVHAAVDRHRVQQREEIDV